MSPDAPITVRISAQDAVSCANEHAFTWLLMKRLRDAGIPVLGSLHFRGVASGCLTRHEDPYTRNQVFTWHPNAEEIPA